MKSWLYGLTAREHSQLIAILEYLDIEVESPDFALELPSFIVVGSDIEQLRLDDNIPIIYLNTSTYLSGKGEAFFCPLPWRQKDLQPILKRINKSPQLPRLHALDRNLHVRQLESWLIRQALLSSNGVVSRAAASLQIQRTTLIEKMRRYRIDKSEF